MEEDGFVLVRSNKGKRKLSKKPPPPWLISLQVRIGSLTFLFLIIVRFVMLWIRTPLDPDFFVSGSDLLLNKKNILKVLISVADP
jgi:hypothetical protein